jgi:hypothetical protein
MRVQRVGTISLAADRRRPICALGDVYSSSVQDVNARTGHRLRSRGLDSLFECFFSTGVPIEESFDKSKHSKEKHLIDELTLLPLE